MKALRVSHKTVGVLSDLECGAPMHASVTASRRVALWKMRVASSRSELVIWTLRLLAHTKSEMISISQG